MARICSGVVPQHPPITARRSLRRSFASSVQMRPVPHHQIPVSPSRCFKKSRIRFLNDRRGRIPLEFPQDWNHLPGPIPQLIPKRIYTQPSKRLTKAGTSARSKLLPFVVNTAVTNTGRLVFSFAARTAALISYVSLIVSMDQVCPCFLTVLHYSPECFISPQTQRVSHWL